MLILTRRAGETLIIGDDVKITVLNVKGNQVRIGVDAPKNVSVHREEIYLRIKREQDGAAGIVAVEEDEDDIGNKLMPSSRDHNHLSDDK